MTITDTVKDVKIEFRKPTYPIGKVLEDYLERNNRTTQIRIFYDDLLSNVSLSICWTEL